METDYRKFIKDRITTIPVIFKLSKEFIDNERIVKTMVHDYPRNVAYHNQKDILDKVNQYRSEGWQIVNFYIPGWTDPSVARDMGIFIL